MTTTKYAGWRRALLATALAVTAISHAADPNEEDEGADQSAANSAPTAPTAPSGARPSAPRPPVAPGAPAAPGADAGAAAAPRVNNNQILLNFQGADIQAVVKAISQMTGRNFLVDPRVKGQVTIISSKPVPKSAAYQIFLSALKAQGFTAVEGPAGLVRVIPIAEAKQGADVSKETPRGGEQMVTHVVVLQNISPGQVVPLLRPLMAPTSQLSAHEGTNSLIITDFADNLRRMLGIIERIDQPIASEVTVVPLKNASALDVAELISRLASPALGTPGAPIAVQPGTVAGDRFTIIPDLRTNSLLIRTENPGRLAQVRSLIEKLDVPATTGGQTRVIYLRNAEAAKLAEVLRGLLAGEARSAQPQPTVAIPAAPGAPRPGGAGRSGAEASLIQADEATNALIINASDAVYNNLRAVIEKLDVRRAQVFVEALIAEITSDKASELGFQWAAAGRAGEGGIAGLQNFRGGQDGGLVNVITNPATALGATNGLSLAFLGKTITLPDGTKVRSIGALARALQSNNLANILSTPNLLTLDNAEAKIIVGQNVPFVTGSFVSPASSGSPTTGVNPFQTIERRDVGIQLRIKPQISEGGGVKLDIFQEISTVTPAPAGVTASDIITNKRSVETKVLVDDGATVVLGGLIEDRVTETRTQVPILGSIPLLGVLFRSTTAEKQKTNLMVFLRPTILRSLEDSYRVSTDRYEYMRGLRGVAESVEVLERLKPSVPSAKPPAPVREKEPEKSKSDETAAPPAAGPATPPAEPRNPG
ncbi:MAG: type II secretion system secretin GspD [Sulfurifustaceae bacterium]